MAEDGPFLPGGSLDENAGDMPVNVVAEQEVSMSDLDLELPQLPESVWLRVLANALDPDAAPVSPDIVPDPLTESLLDDGVDGFDTTDDHSTSTHPDQGLVDGSEGHTDSGHDGGAHDDGNHDDGMHDGGMHDGGFHEAAHDDADWQFAGGTEHGSQDAGLPDQALPDHGGADPGAVDGGDSADHGWLS